MKDPERSAESTVFSWIIDLKEFAYVGDEKLRLSDAKVQFVNLYNNTLHFYCNDGYDRSLHLSKGDVSVSYVKSTRLLVTDSYDGKLRSAEWIRDEKDDRTLQQYSIYSVKNVALYRAAATRWDICCKIRVLVTVVLSVGVSFTVPVAFASRELRAPLIFSFVGKGRTMAGVLYEQFLHDTSAILGLKKAVFRSFRGLHLEGSVYIKLTKADLTNNRNSLNIINELDARAGYPSDIKTLLHCHFADAVHCTEMPIGPQRNGDESSQHGFTFIPIWKAILYKVVEFPNARWNDIFHGITISCRWSIKMSVDVTYLAAGVFHIDLYNELEKWLENYTEAHYHNATPADVEDEPLDDAVLHGSQRIVDTGFVLASELTEHIQCADSTLKTVFHVLLTIAVTEVLAFFVVVAIKMLCIDKRVKRERVQAAALQTLVENERIKLAELKNQMLQPQVQINLQQENRRMELQMYRKIANPRTMEVVVDPGASFGHSPLGESTVVRCRHSGRGGVVVCVFINEIQTSTERMSSISGPSGKLAFQWMSENTALALI
ncbi:unnamed protein product [Toxocara canis]|uniref:Protein kinase domain-containing protein n=1 Tax=Toxocara canis TaxID=6265 RepID=A0A183UTK7_TOXCA|nr:unnamed protein product [Toxocara canis]